MSGGSLLLFLFLFISRNVLAEDDDESSCSPWLGYCQTYEACCRDLECSTYINKCVPILGTRASVKDNRPVGSGPFPSEEVPLPYIGSFRLFTGK